MDLRLARPPFCFACLLVAVATLASCTVGSTAPQKKKKRSPIDPGEDFFDDDYPSFVEPIQPDLVNENSGAFGASERPARDTRDAGRSPEPDGPKVYCGPTVTEGDLAIVELMIASKPGSGDSGEWVEVQSTRNCWLKLRGVSVESPRGAAMPNVATFVDDFELGPHGTFVVAGSSDFAGKHGVTGKIIAWKATDVLKNTGDTIVVKAGDVVIDMLTYPEFGNLEAGRSISFPNDCVWSDRSSWERWSFAFNEFSTGLRGTPNSENADVACY